MESDAQPGQLLTAERVTAVADMPPIDSKIVPPGGILDLSRSIPIADVVWRRRAQVSGRVRSIRVRPWGDAVITLEAVVVDSTGGLAVAFLGRRSIPGLALGGPLTVEGMAGARAGKLLILNPAYDLRPIPR